MNLRPRREGGRALGSRASPPRPREGGSSAPQAARLRGHRDAPKLGRRPCTSRWLRGPERAQPTCLQTSEWGRVSSALREPAQPRGCQRPRQKALRARHRLEGQGCQTVSAQQPGAQAGKGPHRHRLAAERTLKCPRLLPGSLASLNPHHRAAPRRAWGEHGLLSCTSPPPPARAVVYTESRM